MTAGAAAAASAGPEGDQAFAERSKLGNLCVDRGDLRLQQALDLGNHLRAATALGDHEQLADLLEREAERLGPADEAQLGLLLGPVDAVAVGGPLGADQPDGVGGRQPPLEAFRRAKAWGLRLRPGSSLGTSYSGAMRMGAKYRSCLSVAGIPRRLSAHTA